MLYKYMYKCGKPKATGTVKLLLKNNAMLSNISDVLREEFLGLVHPCTLYMYVISNVQNPSVV